MKFVYAIMKCVSKSANRKYLKKVLKGLSLDDEYETALEVIEDLREMYSKKLEPTILKYNADADEFVDKYLGKKLEELGVNVDELIERKNKVLSKMGVLKMEEVKVEFDEVDRISELKDELLLTRIKEMSEMLADIETKYKQQKKDYRVAIEKKMIEKKDSMDEAVKAQIEQEAIEKFLRSQQKNTLKGGIRVGRRQRK